MEATHILGQQTESVTLKKALASMKEELVQGHPLSEAASKHPRIFSAFFINMIKAGEADGMMDETLQRLEAHYDKQHQMKQKILSALA